jgi:hypothetical protein
MSGAQKPARAARLDYAYYGNTISTRRSSR